MKQSSSLVISLVIFCSLLAACGGANSGSNSQAEGAGKQTEYVGKLQASFQDFLGNYKITACSASTKPEQNCKFQTAQLKIEQKDGYQSLLMERHYQSADANGGVSESETLGVGLSVFGHPEVSCKFSYGQSACTASNLQDHPGVYLNVFFSKRDDGAVQYREESADPQRAENKQVLTLLLTPHK